MAGLFKVCIEKIAAGGSGLAWIDGKTAFIEGSIPGETVICRVSEDRRTWFQAELLEILEPSPDRVQPVCALWGICGGCNVQHISYPAQLAAKKAILTEAFYRIGGFSPPEPFIIPSDPWEYRNRMQFHAVRQHKKEEQTAWGLKARKKGDIIPVSDCPIADPGIRSVLQVQSADTKTTSQLIPPGKDRFSVYARKGLFLSEGAEKRGKTQILDRDLILDTRVFFQSNGAMLEKLITDLREIVKSADYSQPMADLYCGVGTYAAFLGERFPQIDLVEENKTALSLANENLRGKPASFYAQRSEQWAKSGIPSHYGFIIADPPRQGFEPSLSRRLAAEGPPLLAYVSCDPATLARDSAILLKGGYELTELRLYDFYPQTAHIESLALFVRLK